MAQKLYLDNPAYITRFETNKTTFVGSDLSWLNALRADAMARFRDCGIPGPKVEEWRYTNLTFMAIESFGSIIKAGQEKEVRMYFDKTYVRAIKGSVVVFVNGYIERRLSSFVGQEEDYFTFFSEKPEDFRSSLEKSAGSTSFNDLNRALLTDGYCLKLSENIVLDSPIQIIHLATSTAHLKSFHTRNVIDVGNNSKVQIIESFFGPNDTRYWSHMVTDAFLAKGADISYVQLQEQGIQALHMTEFHTSIGEDARFNHLSFQLGAGLGRTEIMNNFTGENAKIELRGAYLGRLEQSHDIFTRINHNTPNCESDQFFRGVLDAGAKSAFQGKIVVGRNAQKTNANQSNKNILLDRKAEANAKPELLIYADDVKCSHGATVGELDLEQLFYLRARGLDEAAAKGLLVSAFVAEVFETLENDIFREKMMEKASDWLKEEAVS